VEEVGDYFVGDVEIIIIYSTNHDEIMKYKIRYDMEVFALNSPPHSAYGLLAKKFHFFLGDPTNSLRLFSGFKMNELT